MPKAPDMRSLRPRRKRSRAPGDRHVGSSFDDFLAEQGILGAVSAVALKRVVAWEVARIMAEKSLSKAEMARRMKTSRAAIDRLLDPANPSVTLQTLDRAAAALGRRLEVRLVEA